MIEKRRRARTVFDHINESDDIRTPDEVAEDLDLSLDLDVRDGLEDLDDASIIIGGIDALKDLVKAVDGESWK
jgi:hypothetical protein